MTDYRPEDESGAENSSPEQPNESQQPAEAQSTPAWGQPSAEESPYGQPPSQPAQPEQAAQPWGQPPAQPQQWGQPSAPASDPYAYNPQPPAQAQQPWGQPPAQQWGQQPEQAANPYANNSQQPAQPQQPWGQAQSPQFGQPAQPWGQPTQQFGGAQPPYGASGQQQAPQAPWAQQQPGQPGQPGQPWGPASAGAPYGSPYGDVPEKKKSLAWLWVLLAAIVVIGGIVWGIIALLGSGPSTEEIAGFRTDCTNGSAAACEDLYQAAEAGSPDEEFGQTCGGRADGTAVCADVDMSQPANSFGTQVDSSTLYSDCSNGDAQACEDLYQTSDLGSADEEFGLTCGGRTDGGVACAEADMSQPANSYDAGEGTEPDTSTGDDEGGAEGSSEGLAPLAIDDPNGCLESWCEDGDLFGDNPRLDTLYTACESGNMRACDDLFWIAPPASEYEAMGGSCGDLEAGESDYWCSDRGAELMETMGSDF